MRTGAMIISLCASIAVSAPARVIGMDFESWVDSVIERRAAEHIGAISTAASIRSNEKQAEAPSSSSSTTSLIDTTSAADLIGIAVNLAGLNAASSGGGGGDATSGAVTVSTYALYSAIFAIDPLQHEAYCSQAARWARRLSFTLGFDDQSKATAQNPRSGRAIVAGTKATLWSEVDVCDLDLSTVQTALESSTGARARISKRAQENLRAAYAAGELPVTAARPGLSPDEFATEVLEYAASFEKLLDALGSEAEAMILGDIDVTTFVELNRRVEQKLAEFRQQKQLAVSFQTVQREDTGSDDYRAEGIFSWGLDERLTLGLNGSYDVRHTPMQADAHGGRIAGALQFQPFQDALVGPKPLRFSISGNAQWREKASPIYQGQLKVNLPIPRIETLAGLELPLSLTVSNRTDLIDEVEVRGMVGFTLDTSQVLAALRR